jgi:hypothetical protein
MGNVLAALVPGQGFKCNLSSKVSNFSTILKIDGAARAALAESLASTAVTAVAWRCAMPGVQTVGDGIEPMPADKADGP